MGEADVGAAGPVDVEAVGVVPALLVVVGRAEVADDGGALGDPDPAHLGVPRGGAGDDQERRLPADALLDRGRDQGAVLADGLELCRVGQEAVEQVRRGAVGGLGARRQEQTAERVDVLVVEPLTVLLGRGEHRDHVVAGLGSALLEDAAEVLLQLGRRRHRPIEVDRHADQLDRQPVEPRQVLVGEPEQRGDDRQGEREQELAHEVDAAVVDEPVDHPVHERTDQLGLPPLHGPLRERLLEDRPVGVVLGLVHLQDRLAEDQPHDLGVARRAERRPVAQDRVDRVERVGGEHGDAERLDVGRIHQPDAGTAMDGRLGPSLPVVRVRRVVAAGPHRSVELLERIRHVATSGPRLRP